MRRRINKKRNNERDLKRTKRSAVVYLSRSEICCSDNLDWTLRTWKYCMSFECRSWCWVFILDDRKSEEGEIGIGNPSCLNWLFLFRTNMKGKYISTPPLLHIQPRNKFQELALQEHEPQILRISVILYFSWK